MLVKMNDMSFDTDSHSCEKYTYRHLGTVLRKVFRIVSQLIQYLIIGPILFNIFSITIMLLVLSILIG